MITCSEAVEQTPRPELFLLNAHWAETLAMLEAEATPYPWSHQQFVDSLGASQTTALGWSGNEGLIGFALIQRVVEEAHLLNFAIAARYQRQRFGQRCLQGAMEWAAADGASVLFLEVRESNLAARTLYQRAAFKEIDKRRCYYPTATGYEDALCLRAILAGSAPYRHQHTLDSF